MQIYDSYLLKARRDLEKGCASKRHDVVSSGAQSASPLAPVCSTSKFSKQPPTLEILLTLSCQNRLSRDVFISCESQALDVKLPYAGEDARICFCGGLWWVLFGAQPVRLKSDLDMWIRNLNLTLASCSCGQTLLKKCSDSQAWLMSGRCPLVLFTEPSGVRVFKVSVLEIQVLNRSHRTLDPSRAGGGARVFAVSTAHAVHLGFQAQSVWWSRRGDWRQFVQASSRLGMVLGAVDGTFFPLPLLKRPPRPKA